MSFAGAKRGPPSPAREAARARDMRIKLAEANVIAKARALYRAGPDTKIEAAFAYHEAAMALGEADDAPHKETP
jgi:hypothetical protein